MDAADLTRSAAPGAEASRRALRIGLTGGIGSGKTTVAGLLAEHGATVVDTDRIAYELTAPGGAAIAAIVSAFGAGALRPDGALDRAAMRQRVFAEATAKQRLEAILHPLIGAEAERQASRIADRCPTTAATPAPAADLPVMTTTCTDSPVDPAVVVFDVPLLVESGRWRARVDRVLVVDCREATQIERVMRRSGWTAAAVQAVIERQATRSQRRASADAVIFNDTLTPVQLAAEVRSVWQRWVSGIR